MRRLIAALVVLALVPPALASAATKPKPTPKPTATKQAVPKPPVYAPAVDVRLSEVSCEQDRVEVENTNARYPALLTGWLLSDAGPGKASVDTAYEFPAGFKVPARSVVQVRKLGFKIGCGDDSVFLMASLTNVVDRVTVPNLADGFTWARVAGAWAASVPTPGAPNVAAPAGAVVDRAAWIFDPHREMRIDLTVLPADLQAMAADSTLHVPALFRMTDAQNRKLPAEGPMAISIREKGQYGSRTQPMYGPGGLDIVKDKVGIRLAFDTYVKGQHFQGLVGLTLNNMVQDPTMTHETLAYQLDRAMGLMAPRTGFANVYINGVPRGLYLTLEPYDKVSLAWRFPTVQHVYEGRIDTTTATGTYIADADVLPEVAPLFRSDVGDKKNRADIIALADALASAPGFGSSAERLLDRTSLGRQLAAMKYMNDWDGFAGSFPANPKNYYLVSDGTGRFTVLQWGPDQTWLSQFLAVETPTYVERFDTGTALLFRHCLADASCTAAYRQGLADAARLAAGYADAAWLLILEHEASRLADPLRRAKESDTMFSYELMRAFLAQRSSDVAAYLAPASAPSPSPAPTATPAAAP